MTILYQSIIVKNSYNNNWRENHCRNSF